MWWRTALTVSVVRDGDDSVRPPPELGVGDDKGHEHGQDDERCPQDVDGECLRRHLHRILGPEVVHPGESRRVVPRGVEEPLAPHVVRDADDAGQGRKAGGGVGGRERNKTWVRMINMLPCMVLVVLVKTIMCEKAGK